MQVLVENFVPVEWKNDNLYFFGIEAIIFWKSPSLKSLLSPFMREFGQELYWLLIAFEATKGTYEDYHKMVEELGKNFEEGFNKWGQAVKNAGWGDIRISSLDFESKEATVQVRNPWEIKIDRPDDLMYWCPFLCGKFSGIFSSAFKNSSRARVASFREEGGSLLVSFTVSQTDVTIEEEVKSWMEKGSLRPERKQDVMRVSLHEQNKRFRDVLFALGSFVWQSDKNFGLTFFTEDLAQTLNQSVDQLKHKKITDIVLFEHLEDFFQKVDELKSSSKDKIANIDLRLKEEFNGKWLNLRFKAVYDITGNFYGLRGAGRDITKERELEEKLEEQREKATYSAKMAALGEMSGGVAHEINNPLAILSGQLDLIQMKEAKGTLDHKTFQDSCQSMKATIERIANIVSGLRKFSRDDDSVEREKINVRTLFDDTLNLCSEKFKRVGICISQSIEPHDLSVNCHSVQIEQVLINLLNNAYDALSKRDEQKWVRLEAYREEGEVIISVTDSGNGISAEILDRLMTPFFTTKEVGEGTGLGLSISLGIAHTHGGDLFYDEEDPNTRFVLKLPA